MKKRILGLLLAVILMVSVVPVSNAMTLQDLIKGITKVTDVAEQKLVEIRNAIQDEFKDYKVSEWYANYVAKLAGVGGIKGYPDKTIRPNGTITNAEFLKILVASIYGEQAPIGTHWASGYIDKAEKVGILSSGEVSANELDITVTRQEMAKYISQALTLSLGEAKGTNIEEVKAMITDTSKIGSNYAEHVYNAYGKGIITGYPDGSFKPSNSATRAEASTMLVRMLDEKERVVVGYKTVDDLGIVPQATSSFGTTFNNSAGSRFSNVYVVKQANLPIKLSANVVLHDIAISSDNKNILVIQECKNGAARVGVYLAVKNEGFRWRSPFEYYEKDLGNSRYQTTHKIVDSIEADYKTFSLDKVAYFVFMDSANNRFIAIEKEDALSD